MNNIGVDEDSDYLEVIKTKMVNQQTFYGVILCTYFAIRAIGESEEGIGSTFFFTIDTNTQS